MSFAENNYIISQVYSLVPKKYLMDAIMDR